MDNCRILAAYATEIDAFITFCIVYPITIFVTNVREKHMFWVITLILTCNILYRKISAKNVDGIVIIHLLLGLFALDFSIDCKY